MSEDNATGAPKINLQSFMIERMLAHTCDHSKCEEERGELRRVLEKAKPVIEILRGMLRHVPGVTITDAPILAEIDAALKKQGGET